MTLSDFCRDHGFTTDDFDMTAAQLDDKYNPEGEGEHPYFSRWDWRQDVASDHTLLGYWEWVVYQLVELKDDL